MNNPGTPSFRSLSELTEYLVTLEKRLVGLEVENKQLKEAVERANYKSSLAAEKARVQIPNSRIFSDSFLMRAFAIYGHVIVASLIVSIPMAICYFILMFAVFQNMMPAGGY